ncbi:MAG TPA: iron-containing redox enzyme family protein [Thermoanaerobaculia bacterium]|nr:iron-containing redox enzyme family protein [Thermoanaerobaculia bacterium]
MLQLHHLGEPEPPLGNGELIRQKQLLVGPALLAGGLRLRKHARIADLYPSLLVRAHGLARATVPLMRAAIARLEEMRGEEPLLAEKLIPFLTRFAAEERGHDEWLLQDLEVLGISRREVLARIPPARIASVVGAHYYWIAHHHPAAILGYCFVTETGSPPTAEVEDLIRRTGYPREAFRSLLRHAVIDLKHGADMERALDTLPLTEEHLALIGVSVLHTTQGLAASAEEIVDLHEMRGGASGGGGIRLY